MAQVPADSPNVVFVMTDDAVMADMEAMRYTTGLFERRGVEFRNSFASFPLCCPSRVTFLTGQYGHNHGIMSNKASEGGGYENYDDDGSLPVRLEKAGYRTGFIGKYMNGYKIDEVPDGWSHWAGKKGALYDYELNVDGEVREYGDGPEDYSTDVANQYALDFIAESADDEAPFFLWLSYQAPHGEKGGGDRLLNPRPAPRHRDAFAERDFDEPPSFDEEDVADKPSFVRDADRISADRERNLELRVRARRASLLAVDEGMERIMQTLRQAGVADNTYVFFVSDNGYMFGEHRQSAKTMLYEESLRVPWLALGPGLPAGAVVREFVSNVDWAATIYDIAGVEPGRVPDGRSALPAARGRSTGPGRDLLIENANAKGVRTDGWVYIEHDRDEAETEFEFYDLVEDPYQLENLVRPDDGELREPNPRAERELERLRTRLDDLRECVGEACI